MDSIDGSDACSVKDGCIWTLVLLFDVDYLFETFCVEMINFSLRGACIHSKFHMHTAKPEVQQAL